MAGTNVWVEVRNDSALSQEFILASGNVPLHDATVLFLPVGQSLTLPFQEPLTNVQLFISQKPPGLQLGIDEPAGSLLSPGFGETAVFRYTGSGLPAEIESFVERARF